MKVRFGVTLEIGAVSQEYAVFGDLCRFLDDSGVAAVWIGDEQSMRREIYVGMTVVALNSQHLTLNVGPTNPLTRHLAVTASGMSTLDEVSGGRAALTMSVGFTNVANVGLKPARLVELKEYILAIKALWRDHEIEYQGRTVRLLWPDRSIPIYMTAEGPRTMPHSKTALPTTNRLAQAALVTCLFIAVVFIPATLGAPVTAKTRRVIF